MTSPQRWTQADGQRRAEEGCGYQQARILKRGARQAIQLVNEAATSISSACQGLTEAGSGGESSLPNAMVLCP
jgi:hypothetical protein